MGLRLEYSEGQTPIDEDELQDLLLPHITLQSELNEVEQLNIDNAQEWILLHKFKKERVLTEAFIKELHKKMYGDVWRWAGKQRKSNKNIGVPSHEIPVYLKQLLDDCLYWIEQETYPPDEIAIRFKHRLVWIHCFPNGNGRHSRMMADIIISHIFGLEVFSWGDSDIQKNGNMRLQYIAAIKKGDEGEFGPLISFARD
jgi:Fic-DOC domain mobile mystery protein B